MTASVAFGTQLQLGASYSLIVFGWFVLVNTTIFVLSISDRGEGGIDKVNVAALLLAGVSIVLWLTIDAAWGLIFILMADTVGMVLTVIKTWKDPHSEPRMMWGLGSVAALLSVLSVGSTQLILLVAPLHFLACDLVMIGVILWRRRKLQPATA